LPVGYFARDQGLPFADSLTFRSRGQGSRRPIATSPARGRSTSSAWSPASRWPC